jgi:hypothetical protein
MQRNGLEQLSGIFSYEDLMHLIFTHLMSLKENFLFWFVSNYYIFCRRERGCCVSFVEEIFNFLLNQSLFYLSNSMQESVITAYLSGSSSPFMEPKFHYHDYKSRLWFLSWERMNPVRRLSIRKHFKRSPPNATACFLFGKFRVAQLVKKFYYRSYKSSPLVPYESSPCPDISLSTF